jgi:hypothetical protein
MEFGFGIDMGYKDDAKRAEAFAAFSKKVAVALKNNPSFYSKLLIMMTNPGLAPVVYAAMNGEDKASSRVLGKLLEM